MSIATQSSKMEAMPGEPTPTRMPAQGLMRQTTIAQGRAPSIGRSPTRPAGLPGERPGKVAAATVAGLLSSSKFAVSQPARMCGLFLLRVF